MKQCVIYANKDNKKNIKFKFVFGQEDYIERLDTELTKNNVMLEDCSRVYISDLKE